MLWNRALAIGIAGLALVGLVTVAYWRYGDRALVFSERAMLENLWHAYREEYLEPETFRTLDKQRNNITTSEGQAYTMLRAVWMDDRATFDRSWEWTRDNLQRRGDNLFAWLFGLRSDGTFGVLTEQNGQNTASDADVEITLALIFAYSRWQDETYLEEALAIIPNIWQQEVVMINGRPYLAANNIEKVSGAPEIIVNPSYFTPYAYRIFATLDPARNWLGLVDSSYEVLAESLRLPLDRPRSAGLPPDWLAIDRATGAVRAANRSGLTTNYSYDAMRVPWRLGLDALWFNEPRARELLAEMRFLGEEWRQEKRLASTYTHDGEIVFGAETPAMYGGAIGYFIWNEPSVARAVYESKLAALYYPDGMRWRETLSYYDDNLAWFGLALYNQALPNLYELNLR